MDAFFAAIEQRDNPAYRGKPVVIGADPKGGAGRGVVSTCSYEARKFGIHSAMPISHAWRRCPQAIFLEGDMDKYHRVSREIHEVFYTFTPDIEPISIDEAFLDLTGSYHLFGTPHETCLLIKSRIRERTDLTASVGLAPTKMAAKIASDLKKPDGLVEVSAEGLLAFLRPLPVRKLWGLGEKTETILEACGIRTIGDIAKRDVHELVRLLGSNGAHLWQLANGIDERGVEVETEAKSISNETTFEVDTQDKEAIEGALVHLCEKVSERLRVEAVKGRTITLKIRTEGFHTYTRARTLDHATNFSDTIYQAVKSLYDGFEYRDKKIRLVGVKASNLMGGSVRETLFDELYDAKKERVHAALDKIKAKYGDEAIQRARGRTQF